MTKAQSPFLLHLLLIGLSSLPALALTVSLSGLSGSGFIGSASAAVSAKVGLTVTLPITVTAGGARWEVANNGGTDLSNNVVNGSPGLTIRDCCVGAYFGGKLNPAYDTGFTLRVGSPTANPLQMPIAAAPFSNEVLSDTQRIVAGPLTLSDLFVTLSYYFLPDSPTVRTLVTLANPSSGPLTVQVYWASNEGVEETERFVAGTGSGDSSFTTSDRWVVVGDGSAAAPANLHVLFGPGNPPVTPKAVSQIVFRDGDNGGGIGVSFDVAIPAGGTRRLLFFNQMAANDQNALADAVRFNGTWRKADIPLSGLSTVEMSEVVNWNLPAYEVFLPVIQR